MSRKPGSDPSRAKTPSSSGKSGSKPKAKAKGIKPGGVEVSRVEVSRLLGVDPSTVDGWLRRGCPKVATGGRGKAHRLNTAAVVAWLVARELEKESAAAGVVGLEDWRKRKLAAEAETAELDLRQRRAELIEIDTAAELIEAAFSTVRLRLQAIPSKVAARLAALRSAPKCRNLLELEILEVLGELSDGDGIAAGTVERDRERRASKEDRKRGRTHTPPAA